MLGEYVGSLMVCRAIDNVDLLFLSHCPNVVIADINMFKSWLCNVLIYELDASLVVFHY